MLHARSLACPALAALLFAALRALIDGLGVTAFNVAALRMAPDGAPSAAGSPVIVRRARGCKHVKLKRRAGDQSFFLWLEAAALVVGFRSVGPGNALPVCWAALGERK